MCVFWVLRDFVSDLWCGDWCRHEARPSLRQRPFDIPWGGGLDFWIDFWDQSPALCGGREGGNVYFTSGYQEHKRGQFWSACPPDCKYATMTAGKILHIKECHQYIKQSEISATRRNQVCCYCYRRITEMMVWRCGNLIGTVLSSVRLLVCSQLQRVLRHGSRAK